MRPSLLNVVVLSGILAGCAGESNIKPAEVLDESTGMTVGTLQQPIELLESSQNAVLANAKRASFAYLGPIEWDRQGEITYGLWIHVAPGNDRQVTDIHARGAVTLNLDDGPIELAPMAPPSGGSGTYKPVVSWGQTAYFELTVEMLKRMAASQKLTLGCRSADDSIVDFVPGHEARGALTEFEHTRGITDD